MAGKGDKARSNHSRKYRENYDQIDWEQEPKKDKKKSCKYRGKYVKYYK